MLFRSQTSEFNLSAQINVPDGNYLVKELIYFEDRNVSVEGYTTVFFPQNCQAQSLSIPTVIETGNMLQGTIEFANNTNLEARPLFFGNIVDGNKAINQIFTRYCTFISKDIHCNATITRKSFSSHLVRKKVNIEAIRDLLGHENCETTLKYYVHFSTEDLEKIWKESNPYGNRS